MKIVIADNEADLGVRAAARGVNAINDAIARDGAAGMILATGASQFAMLENLVKADIDWARVTVFHLDEYVGLPATHKASFRKYLRERFESRLPAPPRAMHYVNGDGDPRAECERLAALIDDVTIDVCLAGIGENGHLAFNDPPADFEATAPYIVVALDRECRQQQVNEGWYPAVDDVPTHAISMTIPRIMQSRTIVLSVPGPRKADAVRATVTSDITPMVPASILRRHPDTYLFLDRDSAAKLPEGTA